jgi:hypothetical protein
MTAQGLSWALGVVREILSSSSIWVESPNEYETAFAAMRATEAEARDRADAGTISRYRTAPRACGRKIDYRRLEGFRESTPAGLLIGAQAGVPFQGPTHFDFAINMRIAKALGLHDPAVSPRGRRRGD